MGQRIEIESSTVVNDSVIVTTNRSLTGADGEGYSSSEQASVASTFGAKLATDLFESDGGINRVYIASNVVVIERVRQWEPEAIAGASTVIEDFFLYY
jgi:hypothetical protein